MSLRGLSEHDWIEDYDHENGDYDQTCPQCGTEFMGHKRRTECKACVFRHLVAFKQMNYWRLHWFPVPGGHMPQHRQQVLVHYPEWESANGSQCAARVDLTRYYADEADSDLANTCGFVSTGEDRAPDFWAHIMDDPYPWNTLVIGVDWAKGGKP